MIRPLLRVLGHQQYLRFGVRDRVIRHFHNPDTSVTEEFTVPFFGASYRGNFNTFIDWSVFYYGAYSREELLLMADVLELFDKPVVFDVGANVGHHTLFAALRCGLVYSFEPFPAVSRSIEGKIADNKLTNVRLCPFGLGTENTSAPYLPPKGTNTGTGSFTAANSSSEALHLRIRKADDFVTEEGIEKIHFVKIDTEGYEPQVLTGLRETLAKQRPVVFFEWTQNERSGETPTGPALFPRDYAFFQFVPDTVVMGIFRQGYSLPRITNVWQDGNILAVPNEYIARARADHRSSNIARIIGGA